MEKRVATLLSENFDENGATEPEEQAVLLASIHLKVALTNRIVKYAAPPTEGDYPGDNVTDYLEMGRQRLDITCEGVGSTAMGCAGA